MGDSRKQTVWIAGGAALSAALLAYACHKGQGPAALAAAALAGCALTAVLVLPGRLRAAALGAALLKTEGELKDSRAAAAASAARAADSAKELEQFTHIIAHDLKEPLRVITSFSDLLSRRYVGRLDKDADDFIRFITASASRATDLIGALYEYRKVLEPPREVAPVQLLQVLKKAALNLKAAFEEKRARLDCDELPEITGSEHQLTQLFQNLLENSLKFNAAPAPEIRAGFADAGEAWRIWFADNGIGVPADQRERIFLVFQRLHGGDKYPGAGIGLALCRKIAENHGGRIWAGPAETGGTVFTIEFPKRPHAALKANSATGKAADPGPRRPGAGGADA